MATPTLMVQGTSSDAGKSTLVTALCRTLARRGVRVAPFKPQNMALNSAVSGDGGEIARAQAVQAQACGIDPHSDMNPVLLKPYGERAQVILQGRPAMSVQAHDWRAYQLRARSAVHDCYARLAARYDAVVVEGAGSPVEINLRDRDIANMGFAEAVDCPVVLVGDIDRGGVFAQLVGTLALLSASERRRVKGVVINRFRGDRSMLASGLSWLEQRTGKPVLGVLPYLHGLHLEAEDAIDTTVGAVSASNALRAIVPMLPHLSNHTDFDPLRVHPQITLRYIEAGRAIPPADLVLLPGSKSVRADLQWLRDNGWEHALLRHLRYGGKLLGICGGFQMLGHEVRDWHGLEGPPGSARGFGLLDVETELQAGKQLRRVSGTLTLEGAAATGYEIHAGATAGPGLLRPALRLQAGGYEGAMSADGRVLGTYLHGLFETSAARDALLRWAGLPDPSALDYARVKEANLERLADSAEQYLDLARIFALAGLPVAKLHRRAACS